MSRQEKLTLACVTKPHLDRLEKLLPIVLPYVDEAVIVVGEKQEEAIQYVKSFEPKTKCVYRKWDDNFANQWNCFLNYIDDGFILVLDDDELPSKEMLESLDSYINNSNYGNKYCFVEFRSNAVSEGVDNGPNNYWRQLLYRYNPNMHYRGGPKTGCHQYVVGHQNQKGVRSNAVYYHIKSLKDEHRNAARNYFIYGIWKHGSVDGEQREEWHELKQILSRIYPDVKTFPDLDRHLVQGNVHRELKDWMVKTYREHKDNPDMNEGRALIVYYFKYLHPEENEIEGLVPENPPSKPDIPEEN